MPGVDELAQPITHGVARLSVATSPLERGLQDLHTVKGSEVVTLTSLEIPDTEAPTMRSGLRNYSMFADGATPR